jgi:hypothetical protein
MSRVEAPWSQPCITRLWQPVRFYYMWSLLLAGSEIPIIPQEATRNSTLSTWESFHCAGKLYWDQGQFDTTHTILTNIWFIGNLTIPSPLQSYFSFKERGEILRVAKQRLGGIFSRMFWDTIHAIGSRVSAKPLNPKDVNLTDPNRHSNFRYV